MSTGLIEQLKQRSQELSQANTESFQEIVKRVGTAGKVDYDAVLVDLARTGKSVDDLDRALKLLKRRQQWSITYLKGQKAELTYPESQVELKKLQERFETLKREHNARAAPLVQSIEESKAAIVDGARAKAELVNGVDQNVRANILSDVMAGREQLEATQRELADRIKSKSDYIARLGDREENVTKATGELNELQAQHDAMVPAFKKLASDESAAMERLLDPDLL